MKVRVEILIDDTTKAKEVLEVLLRATTEGAQLIGEGRDLEDVVAEEAESEAPVDTPAEDTDEAADVVDEEVPEPDETTEEVSATEQVVKPECFGFYDAEDTDCVGDPNRNIKPCLFVGLCSEAKQLRDTETSETELETEEAEGKHVLGEVEEAEEKKAELDRQSIVYDICNTHSDLIKELVESGALEIAEKATTTSFKVGGRVVFYVAQTGVEKVRLQSGWLKVLGLEADIYPKSAPPGFVQLPYAANREKAMEILRKVLEEIPNA